MLSAEQLGSRLTQINGILTGVKLFYIYIGPSMHVLCFYSSVDHIMLSKCCTISTFVFNKPTLKILYQCVIIFISIYATRYIEHGFLGMEITSFGIATMS